MQSKRESLEISQLVLANRKMRIETEKLRIEIIKTRREGNFYPLMVVAALATAIVACFRLFLS